jgi:hypothetical protein
MAVAGMGDHSSLEQDIMQVTENEFYLVSERMELTVPGDRIDQILSLMMKDQEYTLAAFDFKD